MHVVWWGDGRKFWFAFYRFVLLNHLDGLMMVIVKSIGVSIWEQDSGCLWFSRFVFMYACLVSFAWYINKVLIVESWNLLFFAALRLVIDPYWLHKASSSVCDSPLRPFCLILPLASVVQKSLLSLISISWSSSFPQSQIQYLSGQNGCFLHQQLTRIKVTAAVYLTNCRKDVWGRNEYECVEALVCFLEIVEM